jgi:hypothetical protein
MRERLRVEYEFEKPRFFNDERAVRLAGAIKVKTAKAIGITLSSATGATCGC